VTVKFSRNALFHAVGWLVGWLLVTGYGLDEIGSVPGKCRDTLLPSRSDRIWVPFILHAIHTVGGIFLCG
jgi:hypothetical protein